MDGDGRLDLVVGVIENCGDPRAPNGLPALRHGIPWRMHRMYDAFIARDMDGDGDRDLVTTRGTSGSFDGVIWLEQLRSATPMPAFTPARTDESRPLPLPSREWLDHYVKANTLAAPNRR
jgi:hypothetical protein